ncbi:MAG: TorF family putative porin [Hyphomonadaceae bacterium]
MRIILKPALVTLALMASPMSVAMADDGAFTANIALTSDYVWRGVSQTGEDPAIQAGLDYANSSFYAGAWASNVDFGSGSDASVEVDLYAGFSDEFTNGVSWDVGVISYNFPGTDGEDLGVVEIYGGLGYEFAGGLETGATIAFDPDNESVYAEGTAGYAFSEKFALSGSVGQFSFDGGGDYTNVSLGGTYTAGGVDFDLRYWDTDVDNNPSTEGRVVLTISKEFG